MDYPEGTIIESTGKAPLLYVGQCQAAARKLNSIFLYLQGGKNAKSGAKETGLVAWPHFQNDLSRGAARW